MDIISESHQQLPELGRSEIRKRLMRVFMDCYGVRTRDDLVQKFPGNIVSGKRLVDYSKIYTAFEHFHPKISDIPTWEASIRAMFEKELKGYKICQQAERSKEQQEADEYIARASNRVAHNNSFANNVGVGGLATP